MLNRFTNTIACSLLIVSSVSADADVPEEIPPLHAGIKIDEPDVDGLVISLLNTYILLREGPVIGRTTSSDIAELNFYYASGPNFIADQRLSPRSLSAFSADAIDQLVTLPTNSDTCYVQSIILSSQRLVLAVHNEDNDHPEDVFRCLIAGLWRFHDNDFSDIDVLDWRSSFHKLTDNGSK